MKVSIIVAAYNIEDYIKRCMYSIVNQTFKDIEIIVVNDGSTDNTLNIINDFAKNDARIKIIDKKNGGLIEARKSGLEIASGEYILFLDGDDWLHLEAIEKLYQEAKKDNFDIVLYNFYLAYDNNKLEEKSSFEEIVKHEDRDSIQNIYSDDEDEFISNLEMIKNTKHIFELSKEAAGSLLPEFEQTYSVLKERSQYNG